MRVVEDKVAHTPEENIDNTPVADEMEQSFLAYAMSVIVSRALPDVRDGLKPVHRRILYSMEDLNLGPTVSYVKSARVVGDCFVAGTLVSTPQGLRPIESINVGDEVLDPRGKRIAVKTAFTNPPQDVVDVAFSDGRTLTVTPGQLFRAVNEDLTTEWVKARDLLGRTVLATLGTEGLRDQATGTELPGTRGGAPGALDGFAQHQVVSVTPRPTPEVTYDIEVDTDEHAFVANGFYVHNCIGRFHPHGDAAVYQAMVRLAQDFSMSLPLVDGHGNFGTHSDPAAAARYCISGDTRVRLADGTSPRIDALVGLSADSEADADLEVLDWNGKPVHASKVFNSGVHPVKRVTTRHGYSIAGSHNHPILTLVRGTDGAPTFEWQLLGNIAPGTVTVIARNAGTTAHATAREYNLGVLLGAWVTEGFLSEDRAGFNNTDEHFFNEVLHAYDTIVGGHRYVSSRTTRVDRKTIHELDVQPFRGGMADLLASPLAALAGVKAREKFIPDAVWNGGIGVKRAFLMAAMEGDGSVPTGATPTRQYRLSYSTYSPVLGRQMQDLLLEFGVTSTLRPHVRPSGSTEYRLEINGKLNVQTFAANVGFLSAKRARLTAMLVGAHQKTRGLPGDSFPYVADFVREHATRHRTWLRSNNIDRTERWANDRHRLMEKIGDTTGLLAKVLPVLDSGYFFDPVVTVVDEEPQEVYSIKVDTEDHSFLAGSFVNHNTEARMSHAAAVMTSEIDEDTVDMRPNYDGKLLEPSVMPAGFPNLLVNGTEGIAVGMATKIPPHNLGEVVKACQHLLAHPDATVDDLIQIVPAPDMPTGGLILDVGGAHDAYRTGRGSFRIRARAEVVGREIVVTELPYQVGPEAVIEAIKKLRDTGKLDEVASVVDLSDRLHGMRLVITAKRSSKGVPVNPEAVMRKLFKYTPLEETFAVHNLALVDGAPQTLTLLQMVTHYVNHRLDVTRRRCEFRKAKAATRAHLLEGYLVALAAIDEVVAVIRSSRDTDSARTKLMRQFKLDEVQATSILEMPLRRLTSLEVKKIKDELAELKKQIAELTRYLTDEKAMRTLVSDELGSNSARFTVPRRSTITQVTAADEKTEDLTTVEIPDVPVRLSLSTTGKLGRFGVEPHKGARGKEDALVTSLDCSVRDLVGAVTNTGRLLHLHPIDVPVCEAKAKGGRVEEFIADLARGEHVVALVRADPDAPMLALATRNGFVKRLAAKDLPKKSGQEIIGFKGDDEVVACVPLPAGAEDTCELVLVTSAAQLLRFAADSVRPQGRTGAGVAGIKLGDGARVLTLGVLTDAADAAVVTVTDGGTSKQTPAADYPAKGRAGAGVRCMKMLRNETGLVAALVAPLATVTGVSGTGALVKPPATPARRDAAGEKSDAVTLAVHRP